MTGALRRDEGLNDDRIECVVVGPSYGRFCGRFRRI